MAQPYTDSIIQSYNIARVIQGEEDSIYSSIDFHRTGNFCVTGRSDGAITSTNCTTGTVHKTILSKRYGVDIVRYTQHQDCLLWSSQNESNDHAIRYHSLYDNKFLRYYTGHTKKVTSLMMHPMNDEFISSSLDGTFRMWDIRCVESTGILNLPEKKPVYSSAYDGDGVVFGLYTCDNIVRMYDARRYSDGPFAKFSLHEDTIASALRPLLQTRQFKSKLEVIAIEFSPDQQHVLLNTNAGVLVQLDAFEGKLTRIFSSHSNLRGMKLGASYSPDGSYIACGSDDGTICMYNANTGALTNPNMKGHLGPVYDIKWNPQRHVLGSVHANTLLWLPA